MLHVVAGASPGLAAPDQLKAGNDSMQSHLKRYLEQFARRSGRHEW